ncbi:hypothetical protein MICRO116_540011 [Micrococcus sp. 116]|nr:hypothetical protein MICRO116_540011 [Micrococcus sp. 116]
MVRGLPARPPVRRRGAPECRATRPGRPARPVLRGAWADDPARHGPGRRRGIRAGDRGRPQTTGTGLERLGCLTSSSRMALPSMRRGSVGRSEGASAHGTWKHAGSAPGRRDPAGSAHGTLASAGHPTPARTDPGRPHRRPAQ